MHLPINVKSPNNISKWQIGFNSAFKGLNCAVVGCEWSDSYSGRLTPREIFPVSIEQKAGWAHSRHRHCESERNILSLPGIETRFLGGPFRGLLIIEVPQQTMGYDKTDLNFQINQPT
jgi:hypothetical protein